MGEPLLSVFTHLYLHTTGERVGLLRLTGREIGRRFLVTLNPVFYQRGLRQLFWQQESLIDPPSEGKGSTHASVNDPAGSDKRS